MSDRPSRDVTPIVPPHPYDLGEVVAGSFRALRRRPGLYLGLTLAGVAILAVVLLVVGGALLLSLRGTIGSDLAARPGPAVVALLVLLGIGVVAAGLVQAKTTGMMALATKQLADGRPVTLEGLWRGTRGFLPRLVLLGVCLYGAVTAVVVVIVLGLALAAAGAADGSGSGSGAAVAVLLAFLAFAALAPVAVYFYVRWLFTLPVLAIEGTGAFAALGRSWRLTAGRFWRTFGYVLLAGLIVFVVQFAFGLPAQLAGASTGTALGGGVSGETPELTSAFLAAMGLSLSLSLLSSIVTTPFMAVYQTLMYVDAQRRTDAPPTPYGGYVGYRYPGMP